MIPAGVLTSSSPSRISKEKKGGGGRIVRALSPMRSDVHSSAAVDDNGEAAAAVHTVALTPPRATLHETVHSGRSTETSSLSESQPQPQRDAVSPMTGRSRVRVNHQHHERENIAKMANLPHYQQPLARSAVSGSRAKQIPSYASPMKTVPKISFETPTPCNGPGPFPSPLSACSPSTVTDKATSPFLKITEQREKKYDT